MGEIDADIDESAGAMGTALDSGRGILRLAPNRMPRIFCTPGRRTGLHPEDCFACGHGRGNPELGQDRPGE